MAVATLRKDIIPAPHPNRERIVSEREEWVLLGMTRARSFESDWNVPVWRRLRGSLDINALETALAALIARHETLRTGYRRAGLRFTRIIAPSASVRVERATLRRWPPDERLREAEKMAYKDAYAPFDIREPPLVRARLIELAPNDHVLILTVHHIVADRSSTVILLRDLAALYSSVVNGTPAQLPTLALQYADYAAWRREDKQGTFAAHRKYWNDRLASARPLPRFLSAPQTVEGDAEFRVLEIPTLPKAVAETIRGFCETENATLFMVFLTIYKALLVRYTRATDIFVDCQAANRLRPELRHLVAHLFSGIRLRTDLSGDPSFRDALARVRQSALDGFAHQELETDFHTFEKHDRKTPDALFVQFVLRAASEQRQLDGDPGMPGLVVTPFGVIPHATGSDLSFAIMEAVDGSVHGAIAYRTTVFDSGFIERMASHYMRLLTDAMANPDARLSELSVLGDKESRQLRGVAGGQARGSHTRVLEWLGKVQPDRLTGDAITTKTRSLSFVAVDTLSLRLMEHLCSHAVGLGDVVAVALEDPAETIVSVVGVLRAGASYAVLPSGVPPEALRRFIGAIHARAVISDRVEASTERSLLCIDPPSTLPGLTGALPLIQRVRPDEARVAYIVASQPHRDAWRATAVAYRALRHIVDQWIGRELRSTDVILLGVKRASEAFGVGALSALAKGGSVVVPECDVLASPRQLTELIREQCVSVGIVSPPVVSRLLAKQPDALLGLRLLIVDGAVHDTRSITEAARQRGAGTVLVLHGPSVGPSVSCCHRVERIAPGQTTETFIRGRHFVLDEHLRLLPFGIPGDLYLGGPGIPSGHVVADEAANADFLVPEAPELSDEPRLYRTGWRARMHIDGELELLGRAEEPGVNLSGPRRSPIRILGWLPSLRA